MTNGYQKLENRIMNKVELFNDHFQNFKVYGIPKAQLIIADPPYNLGKNAYASNPSWYVDGDKYNSKDKFFLVGYNNAAFDNQFLRGFFLQNNDKFFGSWFWANSMDVMVLATVYLANKRTEMENFKLSTVAATLGVQVDGDSLHNAMYDIELTKAVFDIVTDINV